MSGKIFPSLENQIFTWENWDEISVMFFQFYNVELIVPIGQFPIGHKFDVAFIDGENSVLVFNDADKNETKFKLNLTVGDKIIEESK